MIHGDAVDDEWLAVWLLREATREFPELIVSVAATNAGSDVISLKDSLAAVTNSAVFTLASASAAEAAFARLEEYPGKIRRSMHRARCKLPVAVAHALSKQPQLIAAAVELLYARDPEQAKTCQHMRCFPPEPAVMVSVQFNRVQYAKLVSQKLQTPPAFRLPPPESPDYKASVLGMKVACGFEILNYEKERMPTEQAQEDGSTGANVDTANFLKLLDTLGNGNKSAIVSEKSAAQRARAAQQFEKGQRYSNGALMSEDLFIAHAAQELSVTMADDTSQRPLAEGAIGIDEDDSWLTLDSDELDIVMRKAESVLHDTLQKDQAPAFAEDDNEAAQDLQGMLAKFEEFLAADSSMEGANFIGAHSDDEYAENSDEDVDLDADEIIAALMETLGADELKSLSKSNTAAHDETSSGPDENRTSAIMRAMDQELSETPVGQSFRQHRQDTAEPAPNSPDAPYELDDVNIDINLVSNIVESFQAQEGLPGPAGTMMGQAGIRMPRPASADDDSTSNKEST
ncbi:hypothetical protein EV183_000765 [Coemansia sp. RSA 2336]|nr:hypothetical protein EV183_000765 [Coemansia sp. RSA 2336]